jgi:hypothetical protein
MANKAPNPKDQGLLAIGSLGFCRPLCLGHSVDGRLRNVSPTRSQVPALDSTTPSFKIQKTVAAVAELADALDSGSSTHKVCRFNSCRPH